MDLAMRSKIEAAGASFEVARREEDLAALMDLTRTLSSQDNIFDILFSVVSRLADILDVDRGSIVLRETMSTGVIVASSDDKQLRNHPIALDKYPELREVFDKGQPLIIRDVKESPILREVIQAEGSLAFSSMALVPIIGEDGPTAALCLKSRAQTEFGDYDIMHAQAVANATAIALNSARTLRQLRDETRALSSAQSKDQKKLLELSKYFDIFESARDPMIVMDHAGQILFANPGAAQLTQRTTQELVGASLVDLLKAEQRGAALDIIGGFQRGSFPTGIDFLLNGPESQTIACLNFSEILGKSEAVLATMRDVTSERAMAHELSKTKEFLERVIESSVDGIVSADLRGNVVVYNRAASRLFGYAREEVVGRMTVDELYAPGVARDIMRRIRRRGHGGEGRLEAYRVEMLTKSQDEVPVNLSASLVLDGRKPIGTVGIFTDIREKLAMEHSLAEAQEQLQESKRQDAIAEMAGAAAHELNQPLTSVMGYAEFVRRGVKDDPSLSHAIEVILSETQRMADIVRKVGRVTRYETKPYVGGAKIVDLDRSSTPEN